MSVYIYSYLWMQNQVISIHGWRVKFYGISTREGYLMPNPVYTYILYIYDL